MKMLTFSVISLVKHAMKCKMILFTEKTEKHRNNFKENSPWKRSHKIFQYFKSIVLSFHPNCSRSQINYKLFCAAISINF